MVAKCIANREGNPNYTVGRSYKISEDGMASNFDMDGRPVDTWYGQFSMDRKPKLVVGTEFKRNACHFIIENENEEAVLSN